ncbi:unnamed protein product [Vitrella brassicaformis CCMP3155]|uniref:30S ribosomal protein S9, chloroplastic n=1 Tax=Vitrella brassicaformis (strain CCMP3155) TaxID=1169540 RepID=A0A0G4E8L5_VITBC|nr:unnamed protein product [Vitrella brassicaformis CCMP3155]|eukprot:CEL91847.1 unnamed protein product [Vitrella brassicaformis CCMP3155]
MMAVEDPQSALDTTSTTATMDAGDEMVIPAGRGSRKSARAKVILRPGEGRLVINGREGESYLQNNVWWVQEVRSPLEATGLESEYDIIAFARGGGYGGKAGAIKSALARALVVDRPELRPVLKKEGLMTIDSRRVERKKYGLKKARKAPQYSKR